MVIVPYTLYEPLPQVDICPHPAIMLNPRLSINHKSSAVLSKALNYLKRYDESWAFSRTISHEIHTGHEWSHIKTESLWITGTVNKV